MSGETYDGTLTPEGTLVWSDGAVWVRKREDVPSGQRQAAEEAKQRAIAEAKRRADEMAQKQARGLATGLDRPMQSPMGAVSDDAKAWRGLERLLRKRKPERLLHWSEHEHKRFLHRHQALNIKRQRQKVKLVWTVQG